MATPCWWPIYIPHPGHFVLVGANKIAIHTREVLQANQRATWSLVLAVIGPSCVFGLWMIQSSLTKGSQNKFWRLPKSRIKEFAYLPGVGEGREPPSSFLHFIHDWNAKKTLINELHGTFFVLEHHCRKITASPATNHQLTIMTRGMMYFQRHFPRERLSYLITSFFLILQIVGSLEY